MQVISLGEPCFVQEADSDIKHLPVETCKQLFGWDSACQSIEILVRYEIPDVDFYAVVAVGDEGITLAATEKLGVEHWFIPWSNIVAVHGKITT